MIKSKITFASVILILAAITYGFICFMGANFLNIDNDKVWGMNHTTGCIVIGIFCSMVLFATAYGAKLLKKTSRNFKICFVWEVALLIFFVFFALFFTTKTSPFTHFFTVNDQKSEITSKLGKSIDQAEKIFEAYESYVEKRIYLYNGKLSGVVSAKRSNPRDYQAHGFVNGISDNNQIEDKVFSLKAILYPSNYTDTIEQNGIKELAGEWLKNAKSVSDGWKPIGIVWVVDEIENNSNEWLSYLVTLSKVRENGEQASDFEYPLLVEDVKTYFKKYNSPTLKSIGSALFIYVLMLLSWLVTGRDTRAAGAFTTKPYEVVL